MKKFSLLFLSGFLTGQTYSIGDTVKDFSKEVCSNGEGDLSLYSYNGGENGGEHHVIWINLFATW